MRILKKIAIITGIFIAVMVTGVVAMGASMGAKLKALEFTAIDMERVADGSYDGYVDSGMVKVRVIVDVKDHKIENITLVEHQNGKGTPAEVILDEMVERNTDEVDAVSGATASSKTIRAAVNQALQKGSMVE